MKFERNVCFTRPCEGCEISNLPTEQARIVGAQSVDYVLKHASIVRPFPSEMEMLASVATEEYGIQGARDEVQEAATRVLDNNCPSRTN